MANIRRIGFGTQANVFIYLRFLKRANLYSHTRYHLRDRFVKKTLDQHDPTVHRLAEAFEPKALESFLAQYFSGSFQYRLPGPSLL